MKSNKQTFATRLIVFFAIVVIFAWGGWFWWRDSIAAVDPTDTTPIIFVVARGAGGKEIAADLASQNLIHSSTGFFVLLKVLGIEQDLQAGDFRLNKSMDARTIALELTHGTLDVWVTTLEGWRTEEIALLLASDLDIPEKEFLKYAKEGYMFPDTYLLPRDATAAAIAKVFLDNFDKKVTQEMRDAAKKTGLSFDDVITLASIVEREGKTDADRPVIAGILLNRLKLGMALQVDATLQYAFGYQPFEKSWWKKSLFAEDKKIKSRYNTYANPGLPPGPISNPGLASIQAIINPTETDNLYYLHDPTGAVHFAATLDEHNANVAKYLQ